MSYHLHPLYLSTFQFNPVEDDLVFIDSSDQWTHYQFHKKRLVYHLSAMKHAYIAYQNQGFRVQWLQTNTIQDALATFPDIYVYEPTNRYEKRWFDEKKTTFLEDPLFLVQASSWNEWLPVHKPWKLDPIYRKLRQNLNILMDGDEPIGKQYSFDADNRKPYHHASIIEPIWFAPDTVTQEVLHDVNKRFASHPGTSESFHYPVTRNDALKALDYFVLHRLATFGDVQDMMDQHDAWLSHSLLSGVINLGLLSPMEVIVAAQEAYHKGWATIGATEGFIRQILGWREYVRGVYLVTGESYLSLNKLNHHRPLPTFYYDAKTSMHCLSTTIQETIDHGYNHHIQRLMLLSNYANLAAISPQDINRWFNEMYIDSSEWIVAANVIGMGLFADGGKMSTKPYISSGAYLHKMSNYCDSCSYDVSLKTGPKACPFNSLYWHFIDQHDDVLKNNPRMGMMLKVWNKMDTNVKDAIITTAKNHLMYE